MPRVHTTKSARPSKKVRDCVKCGKPIEPGQSYHQWSFRYAGTRYQHEGCGFPRQSQLTQSKLGAVYAAVESAQDSFHTYTAEAGLLESFKEALGEVSSAATEVAEEYREAAESMGGAGGQNEERAEALDEYANALESWEPSIEEPGEGASEEDWSEYHEALMDEANQALDDMSF